MTRPSAPRLVFSNLPNFWTPNDLMNLIILMGIGIAAVASIVMQEGGQNDADSQSGFVSVHEENTTSLLLTLTYKLQPYVGAPKSNRVARQHAPGVCSACLEPGHIGRQCIRCKTCNKWGHAVAICPTITGSTEE